MLKVEPVPRPTLLPDGLAYSVSEFDAEFHGVMRHQHVVSVSFRQRRASDWQCQRALKLAGFDPASAEEDNHFSGMTRTFFIVEGLDEPGVCECKDDETIVVEPDGYTYSRPKAPGE